MGYYCKNHIKIGEELAIPIEFENCRKNSKKFIQFFFSLISTPNLDMMISIMLCMYCVN